MGIKKMMVGFLGSVIAIGGFLEVATADLKFPMLVYRELEPMHLTVFQMLTDLLIITK